MVCVCADGFLEDFCCGMKSKHLQSPSLSPSAATSCDRNPSEQGSAEPSYRTDSHLGYGDPGGGGGGRAAIERHRPQPAHSENKSLLELKRLQQHYGPPAQQLTPPPPPDADSALEAAVNSILEC